MSFCEGFSVEFLTCYCTDTLHEDCHIRKGGRITFHDHSLSGIASHLKPKCGLSQCCVTILHMWKVYLTCCAIKQEVGNSDSGVSMDGDSTKRVIRTDVHVVQ